MTKLMGMVNYIMPMATCMKENGWTTKPMGVGCILMQMAPNTMGNGKMISNMERALSPGLTEQFMKENTMKERKMVEGN